MYAVRLLLRRAMAVLSCTLLLALSVTVPARADTPKNKGLYITPIRHYVTLRAGETKKSNFTVANYTDNAMDVSFSIKRFSVADYTYDYQFDEGAGKKLVSLGSTGAMLKPGENKIVTYEITVPAGSTPGGRYYTILATGTNPSGPPGQQVQAASLIYMTIDGVLHYNNNLGATKMPRLAFGSRIPFSMDVSNTGNTHYFMYLAARLHGPLTTKSQITESHLLLPLKTRRLESYIPSPVLPGVYGVTYGYRTEFTPPIERSSRLVYIPAWSIALLLVIAGGGWHAYRRPRHKTPVQPPPAAPEPTD